MDRRSTSAAARGRWRRGWPTRATRSQGSTRRRGCSACSEERTSGFGRSGVGNLDPVPDGSFDLVLSVAMMHHIAAPDDVRRTLAEMVRVTSPGGRVLVWDHNPRNPYWRLLMARVPQDTGEERLVGVRELVRGLGDAGAEPVLVTQLGMVPDFTPAPCLRPRQPPSGRRSGPRSCAGCAPTTSSSRRSADSGRVIGLTRALLPSSLAPHREPLRYPAPRSAGYPVARASAWR